MNKYIFKINLMIEDDIDNIEFQDKIETAIESVVDKFSSVSYVSNQVIDLNDNSNCGQCIRCNAWVSDTRCLNYISELSNGAKINGEWYCDLCLPEEHPNAF